MITKQKYYENGILKETGDYDESGKKTGIWQEYNENGVLIYKCKYKHGEKTGTGEEYDENGDLIDSNKKPKKQDVTETKIGKKIKEYHRNGKLKSIITYNKHDKKNGYATEWYANGMCKCEGKYTDGEPKDTTIIEYYYNGKYKSITKYDKYGKIESMKKYCQNGKPLLETLSKAKDGEYQVKEYNMKGDIIFEGSHKDGKRWSGQGTEYNNSNLVTFQGTYKDGEKTDPCVKVEYDEYNNISSCMETRYTQPLIDHYNKEEQEKYGKTIKHAGGEKFNENSGRIFYINDKTLINGHPNDLCVDKTGQCYLCHYGTPVETYNIDQYLQSIDNKKQRRQRIAKHTGSTNKKKLLNNREDNYDKYKIYYVYDKHAFICSEQPFTLKIPDEIHEDLYHTVQTTKNLEECQNYPKGVWKAKDVTIYNEYGHTVFKGEIKNGQIWNGIGKIYNKDNKLVFYGRVIKGQPVDKFGQQVEIKGLILDIKDILSVNERIIKQQQTEIEKSFKKPSLEKNDGKESNNQDCDVYGLRKFYDDNQENKKKDESKKQSNEESESKNESKKESENEEEEESEKENESNEESEEESESKNESEKESEGKKSIKKDQSKLSLKSVKSEDVEKQ